MTRTKLNAESDIRKNNCSNSIIKQHDVLSKHCIDKNHMMIEKKRTPVQHDRATVARNVFTLIFRNSVTRRAHVLRDFKRQKLAITIFAIEYGEIKDFW